MSEDLVRVLRVIEYVGPRSAVERQIENSLHGVKRLFTGVSISAVTLNEYPEVLKNLPKVELPIFTQED